MYTFRDVEHNVAAQCSRGAAPHALVQFHGGTPSRRYRCRASVLQLTAGTHLIPGYGLHSHIQASGRPTLRIRYAMAIATAVKGEDGGRIYSEMDTIEGHVLPMVNGSRFPLDRSNGGAATDGAAAGRDQETRQ